MKKQADLRKEVVLKEHQERAINRILGAEDKSLLAAHATGSGKTLTGIAAFEKLREKGYAKRAIVVVPSSLRSNFIDNGVKKFTNSSVAIYGPKNEGSSKHIGDKSTAVYNVISYDLFREHGDQLILDTGADTLIMDEVHKVRSLEGTTYQKIKELRPKFKQAITLTGSVVNNEPNEVVPLLDITFKPTGHKLISKDFFDRTFVDKKSVTKGLFNPKVYVEKNIKNKKVLSKYLSDRIDFVGHEELEKLMPKKNVEVVEVPMSKEQSEIYHYTLSNVDPITRWKISNNIPVGQREAQDAFSKLTQSRQVSTDPSILSDKLKAKSILATSPKVRRIIEDAEDHLAEDPKRKVIIFGNLITGQLDAIERGLKEKNVDYTKFYGVGNEGSSAKQRDQNIKDFMSGNKKIILISGAGAEGLDLKGTTMLQMVEGHYNPERIHQAQSRAIRLGSPVEKVEIKQYVSKPQPGTGQKLMNAFLKPFGAQSGNAGVDSWIYSIAERKATLNNQFKDVLTKEANNEALEEEFAYELAKKIKTVRGLRPFLVGIGAIGGGIAGVGVGQVTRGITVDQSIPEKSRKGTQKRLTSAPLYGLLAGMGLGGAYAASILDNAPKNLAKAMMKKMSSAYDSDYSDSFGGASSARRSVFRDFDDNAQLNILKTQASTVGEVLGSLPLKPVLIAMQKTTEKEVERTIKQKLLDLNKEQYTKKKHYDNILNESGISQRALDISIGSATALGGASVIKALMDAEAEMTGKEKNIAIKAINAPIDALAGRILKFLQNNVSKFKGEDLVNNKAAKVIASGLLGGLAYGTSVPILQELTKRKLLSKSIETGSEGQLSRGIERYEEKLRKKVESKYKGSKKFINEYDTKKELGVDVIL